MVRHFVERPFLGICVAFFSGFTEVWGSGEEELDVKCPLHPVLSSVPAAGSAWCWTVLAG